MLTLISPGFGMLGSGVTAAAGPGVQTQLGALYDPHDLVTMRIECSRSCSWRAVPELCGWCVGSFPQRLEKHAEGSLCADTWNPNQHARLSTNTASVTLRVLGAS